MKIQKTCASNVCEKAAAQLLLINSQWGQLFGIIELGLTRNAYYAQFIKLLGISPCSLYTPPVAFTNGSPCEVVRQFN